MTLLKVLGHTVVIAAILAMHPAWSGDIASMAENCDGCHGPCGQSTDTAMPTIAGISDLVHADALFAYQEGARPCRISKYRHGDTSRAETDMCNVVKSMSDDDIEAIAAYYAEKPFLAAKQETDAALVSTGKGIHEENCEKCHSEGGSLAADDASVLAGQWIGYLRKTFAEYAAGDRDQPKSMKTKMDKLTTEDTEALLHYYASQQ